MTTDAQPTILDKIVATKRGEIEAARRVRSVESLQEAGAQAPAPRDFLAAVSRPPDVRLIAEVKRQSPSITLLVQEFDPVAIAKTYEQHGASAISVLTDEQYFGGRLEYLQAVRAAVGLPVLRKDFILDPYQLLEARAAGADAVQLIAECLDDQALQELLDGTLELGMTPLVELYEPENVERVVRTGAQLIGINNRDLRTFVTDLDHTVRLRAQIPADRAVVGESGISTQDDVTRLSKAGVSANLVGESLMASEDIGAAVDRLLGH